MPDDFLSALGTGLRGAGAILSPAVYQQSNIELDQRNAQASQMKQYMAQQLVHAIQSGAADPGNPQVQQALTQLGIPPTAFKAGPQAQLAQGEVDANKKFQEFLSKQQGGLQPSALASGAPQLPPNVLASPMAQQWLQIQRQQALAQSQIDDRLERQADRKIQIQSLIDDRERRSEDRSLAREDRERARQESLAFRQQLAQMNESFRRDSLGARTDAAATRSQEKADKAMAPVENLVDQIDAAIRMIDSDPSVVGGRGMLSRAGEFINGVWTGSGATPASDFQSQLIQIQSGWKKLPTVAANRFKADAAKVDDAIKGLGVATSAPQARNSLIQLRDNLKRGMGQEAPAAAAPQPAAEQGIIAVNPKTKERVISTDGGKTWEPLLDK